MDWKKLTLGALLSGSLIMTGCGDDDTTEVDGGPEVDGGGTDAGPGDPLTGECADGDCYFVADELDIARIQGPTGEETVEGFNLDGRVSDETDLMGCELADYTNAAGTMGIDNQFASLVPILEGLAMIDIGMTLEDSILAGDILILMHLTGASGTNDSSVTANLHLAEVVGGGMPTATGRTIDADQSFTITSTDEIEAVGSMSGGTFSASLDLITIALPLMEADVDLNIRNAQITFDVSGATLTNGVIGGSLNIEELVTALAMIPDFAMYEMIARETLGNMADLEPDADGFCENISIGLDFHAVAAVVP